MGIMASHETDHFAFLEDKASITYIKESRLVIYLPGYDGVCQKIQNTYPSAKVFPEESSSKEENSLASQVEKWMKQVSNDSADIAVINHPELVTPEKVGPFSRLAVSYNFVQLYPYKAGNAPLIPLFYGWFFNLTDSADKLRVQAKDLLEEISGKDDFNEEFSQYAMDLPEGEKLNIQTYFSTKTLSVGTTLLHCTAYFTNSETTEDAIAYHKGNAPSFGKAFSLEVIGFIITPRTFGVRLKLNDDELKLWHQDKDSGSKATEKEQGKEDVEWKPSKYSPTNGPGSRAHLTLAVREDVQAVQTGVDLGAIIKEEVEDQKTGKKRKTIKLTAGEARCYGEGSWAVYLDKYQDFQALFSNFYLKEE